MLITVPTHSERPDAEPHLARFFELAGDLMCVLDAHGIVRRANGGLSVLGYSRGELLGKDLLAEVHPDDAPTTRTQLGAATKGGAAVRFESRLRAKDGTYRWLGWLVSHEADHGFLAILRDLTERKWAERELEASLSLVESALESTADGLLVVDGAGRAVTFNRKLLDMWGISDDVVFAGPQSIDDICDAKVRRSEGHLSLVGELHESSDVERYEVLLLEDGRVFDRYSRPRRLAGALDGRVWSFRDVTERARAERELRDHLLMGIEHAVEGIGRLDERGRFTSINAALAGMFEVDEKEILGTEWGARFHPDDRARVVAAREQTASEAKIEIEARTLRKDGAVAHLRALLVRVDSTGGSSGCHVFLRDITEQKEMQERLLLADRLASMGTLAAGVAHEINNPLSFVITNLALATELISAVAATVDAPKLRESMELLGEVRDGAERVRRIVRDLKVFSRPDDATSGAVDVQKVLESSINMASNEIRHRARLVKDYGPVRMVEGNDAQLGQVFLNLLLNAAQAIPEGSVEENEIRVVTRAGADQGCVVVEVSDTGAGIPAAVLSRVFDPFFTTKPVGMGTGLGLSVCHGIVAKLGGEIEVESTPGAGTTFRVLLRRGADRPASGSLLVAAPQTEAPAVKRRVLVVDDEEMIAKSVTRILARDYEVVACTSGRDALSLLAGEPPFELVLCDLMMPDLTGMDVHEHLARTLPALAARMVFMTGGIFTERAEAFLAAVPNARLDKPLDVQILRACLRETLERP